MAGENIQQHLQALKDYVSNIQNGDGDIIDIRVKKKQLSAIQRTIRQLEKSSVPVPESLSNEKLTLVSEISDLENASSGCTQTYEALIDIIFDFSLACGKLPHKDLYRRIREWRKKTTPPDTLRKVIINILKESSGSAKERDIVPLIEKRLKTNFTPADLERPGGKRFKWQTNTRRERKRMITDGILTQDSKRSTWTLTK